MTVLVAISAGYWQMSLPGLCGSSAHFPLQHSDPELHEEPSAEQHFESLPEFRVQVPGLLFVRHARDASPSGQS